MNLPRAEVAAPHPDEGTVDVRQTGSLYLYNETMSGQSPKSGSTNF